MTYLNLVGPQIRMLRDQRGMSQRELAIKLQLQGWDISRESLGKIECRLHRVTDAELIWFAHGFKVPISDLYPPLKEDVLFRQIRDEFLK